MEKKNTDSPAFSRSALLLGEDAEDILRDSSVALFGIGGVGSFVAEALARSGVGHFLLVDSDTVSESNLNRQLVALRSTIGQYKTQVMKERIRDINPEAAVETSEVFILPGENGLIHEPRLPENCDYIIDAIDTVSAKIALVLTARERGIPIISAAGCGNKYDPSLFRAADIGDTSVCPLCRVLRRELKKRGIEHLKVIYSSEQPMRALADTQEESGNGKKRSPGSLPWVPSAAGLMLAGEVVMDILKRRRAIQR